MPLIPGKKQVSKNISELHKGKTYRSTAKKYGKEVANKQAIAIALNFAGQSKKTKKKGIYRSSKV